MGKTALQINDSTSEEKPRATRRRKKIIPPKSLREALMAGWREAEGHGLMQYWTSYDYRTLEGYFEFGMGAEPQQDTSRILRIPVKVKLILGKPYFKKQERKKKVVAVPERKT